MNCLRKGLRAITLFAVITAVLLGLCACFETTDMPIVYFTANITLEMPEEKPKAGKEYAVTVKLSVDIYDKTKMIYRTGEDGLSFIKTVFYLKGQQYEPDFDLTGTTENTIEQSQEFVKPDFINPKEAGIYEIYACASLTVNGENLLVKSKIFEITVEKEIENEK